MKFVLRVRHTYRDDGDDAWLSDFDCRVPMSWREGAWRKTFCSLRYMSQHGGIPFTQPPPDWMSEGRNHQPSHDFDHDTVDASQVWWEREVEEFSWFVELDTLENFIAFTEAWNCNLEDGGLVGRFDEARQADSEGRT